MQIDLKTPDQDTLNNDAQIVLEVAETYVIDSPLMFAEAGEELKRIKAKSKELNDKRVAITKPLDDAKKAVMDLFRKPVEILSQAELVLKNSIVNYQEEQARIARLEQQKQAEAQRIEREALEAKARAAEEAARKEAEELQRKANEAAKNGNEAEAQKMAEQAQLAFQTGQAQANVIAQEASAMNAPVTVAAPSKVSGISMRETWKAEVTDKEALVKFIATNPHLLNLVDVNNSAVNQMAKAMKGNLNIPGVRAYAEKSVAARA